MLVTHRTRLALSLGMSAGLVGPAPGALADSVPPAGAATQLTLPDDTLDVSPDGATLLIRSAVDSACVVPLSMPDDDGPCIAIPGRAGQGVFSPDGTRFVLADRAGVTLRQYAVVVDIVSRSVTHIDADFGVATPSTTPGTDPPQTAPAATTPTFGGPAVTSSGAEPGPSTPPAPIVGFAWTDTNELVAWSLRAISRVDLASGELIPISTLPDGSFVWNAVTGGNAVAYQVVTSPADHGQVVIADVTTGMSSTVTLDDREGSTVLDVSGDGTHLLVNTTDLRAVKPGPLQVVDTAAGTVSTLDISPGGLITAGGFSTDGTTVFAVVAGGQEESPLLASIPVGGGVRSVLGPADNTTSGTIRQTGDVLATIGPLSAKTQAWRLVS